MYMPSSVRPYFTTYTYCSLVNSTVFKRVRVMTCLNRTQKSHTKYCVLSFGKLLAYTLLVSLTQRIRQNSYTIDS